MDSDPKTLYPLPLLNGELVLVRHGESTANARGIGQGRAEFPLSARGLEQARLTALYLREASPLNGAVRPFDALISSPQQRALQTAEAIGSALGLPVQFDADLVEIDIGVLSGRRWDELDTTHPQAMSAFRAAEARGPHPRNRELIPGWEAAPEVITRTWRAIARQAHRYPGGRIIIVAHGGVLNAFLTHMLDGPADENPWRYPSTNCAVSRLVLTPAGPVADCLVDDTHLAGLAGSHTVFDTPKTVEAP